MNQGCHACAQGDIVVQVLGTDGVGHVQVRSCPRAATYVHAGHCAEWCTCWLLLAQTPQDAIRHLIQAATCPAPSPALERASPAAFSQTPGCRCAHGGNHPPANPPAGSRMNLGFVMLVWFSGARSRQGFAFRQTCKRSTFIPGKAARAGRQGQGAPPFKPRAPRSCTRALGKSRCRRHITPMAQPAFVHAAVWAAHSMQRSSLGIAQLQRNGFKQPRTQQVWASAAWRGMVVVAPGKAASGVHPTHQRCPAPAAAASRDDPWRRQRPASANTPAGGQGTRGVEKQGRRGQGRRAGLGSNSSAPGCLGAQR